MAGNYLKSLQLAKQLEERAKEAAKSKKLAEDERETLEEFLEVCKKNDVDLSDIDKTLSEFSASMDSKDYQAAIGHSRKALEMAKNAYIQRIADVADSVDALLKLLAGGEGEAKGAKDMLDKSKELVVKDDLEGAMKLAKNAYDAAERAFHESLSALFSKAQGIINQARDMGDDVGLYEDLLGRSKAALEKQEYEASMSQLKEALEGAGENVKAQIEDSILAAEDLVRAGKDIGADVERVGNHIERAKSSLESLRYKDALSYSKRAESEVEKALSSRLNDMIRDIRYAIKAMKTEDEDSRESRELLDRAQEAVKEGQYQQAIRAFTDARDKIQKIHFQAVLGVIAKAKDKFVLAKKVGVDMSEAIKLLNASRKSLKEHQYEEAIRLAQESQDAIESSLQLFYKARDELVELAKTMKLAKSLELDASEPKRLMGEAKKAFEQKDYEMAGKATSEGISIVRRAAFDVAQKRLDEADKAVKLAISIGAEAAEAEGLLEKASTAMTDEDFVEAVSKATESCEAASSGLSSALSERLDSIGEFVSQCAEDDRTISAVKGKLENAKGLVAAKEFEEAHGSINEITAGLEGLCQEECERVAKVAEEKLQMASSMDVDTADAGVLMTRARELLEKRAYQDALMRLKDVVTTLDESIFRALQATFSSIKDSVEEAKTLKIDVSAAKERLKEARAKAEAHEFREAFDLAIGTEELIRDKISRHDAVKEKARKAEELIEEASKNRVEVANLEAKLSEAREAFAEGNIDGAEQMLATLIEDTERQLAMYLAAKFILISKESIDLALGHGISVEYAQTLLSNAKQSMKDKDYDGALENSKKASESAKSALETGVQDMIKEVQRIVTDAKNISIDTVGPEKLVEKASELAQRAEFSEALNCLESAKEDIDHVRNLSSQAAAEIKNARKSLKDAETLNMSADQARESLDQAVDALTRHQYAIALELARKSAEISLDATKTSIRNTLGRFKERMEEAAADGLHLGVADRCVAEGFKAFEAGRYQDALKLAMQCEAEMERAELQKDISTQAVESARKKIEDAVAEGIKADLAAEVVEKAEKLLSKGKYTEALSKSIESGDILHDIRENLDSARIEFSAAREQVDRLKKVNIDTSGCDEILDMAHEYLAAQNFDKFHDALARCSNKSGALFESSVSELMEETKGMISKAKAMGINTKTCEDLLEVARTSFSERLWDFAYQQAQTCRGKCIELVEKKMSNLVDDAEGRLEALGHVGAGVKPIRTLIDEAKSTMTSGNHVRAFDVLMDADQKIQVIEDSNKKYLDIMIAAESAIENLRRLGGSIKEAERLLALADLEKEKDYDSAIELVAEALDTAQTSMESFAPDIAGSISTEGLYGGVESDVTVTLRNNGKAAARAVKVDLSGGFELKSIGRLETLEPGAEGKVVARIVPHDEEEIVISANVTARRRFDSAMDTAEFEERLKVFPSGPPFKISRATEVSRCVLCQGKIKSGFDIVSCRCGDQLHLACAKRAGKCPVCGQKYTF